MPDPLRSPPDPPPPAWKPAARRRQNRWCGHVPSARRRVARPGRSPLFPPSTRSRLVRRFATSTRRFGSMTARMTGRPGRRLPRPGGYCRPASSRPHPPRRRQGTIRLRLANKQRNCLLQEAPAARTNVQRRRRLKFCAPGPDGRRSSLSPDLGGGGGPPRPAGEPARLFADPLPPDQRGARPTRHSDARESPLTSSRPKASPSFPPPRVPTTRPVPRVDNIARALRAAGCTANAT